MKPPFDLGIVGGGEAVKMALPVLRTYGRVVIAHKESLAAQAFPEFAYVDDAARLFNPAFVAALYIATPVNTHASFLEAAIRSSIPALIEKPLCLNTDECRLLKKSASPRVAVAFRKRFSSVAHAIRKFRTVNTYQQCHMEYTWLVPHPGGVHWKAGPQALGGGIILDVGSHVLDLFEHCIGRISNLWLDGFTYDIGAESEAYVRFSCSHGDGSTSSARIGWAQGEAIQRIDFRQGDSLVSWSKAPTTPQGITMTVVGSVAESYPSDRAEEYSEMFQQFQEMVQGKDSSLPTLEDGFRNMELICTLQESIRGSLANHRR